MNPSCGISAPAVRQRRPGCVLLITGFKIHHLPGQNYCSKIWEQAISLRKQVVISSSADGSLSKFTRLTRALVAQFSWSLRQHITEFGHPSSLPQPETKGQREDNKNIFLKKCLFLFKNILWFMLLQLPHFSPFASLQPACPHFCSQSPPCRPRPWALLMCSLTNPSTFFQSVPASPCHTYSCQSVPRVHASGSILLISLFCSLDSFYK